MHPIRTRFFSTGEQKELVKMFEEVMDWPGFVHNGTGLDYWEWKYRRRSCPGFASCAAWSNGHPVSHASWINSQMLVNGRELLAGQISDLYTHPNFRGHGLADRVLGCLNKHSLANDVEMMFAFPSSIGYEIMRKRGYFEIGSQFVQYQLITNPSKFFAQTKLGMLKRMAYEAMLAVRSPSLRGTVEEVDSFPEDVGEMTRAFEARFDLVARHSTEYLNWRYADPAGGMFRILITRQEARTTGFAVLRPYSMDDAHYMDIVDMMFDLNDPMVAQELIAAAISAAQDECADGIQTWLPGGHILAPILGRTGFLIRAPLTGERQLRMLYQTAEGEDELQKTLDRPDLKIHIMLGDTDWV